MRAGAAVKGKATLDDADVIAMVQAMAKGIQDRGKAEPGEKTMVDAWRRRRKRPAQRSAAGKDLGRQPRCRVAAAERGAEATKDMIAAKGRASRLGERSLGHMDPGAASAVTVIEAMRASLAILAGYSILRPASSLSIAWTLPADGPFGSNSEASQVSTIALASSGPMTRAPMVMIWALLDFAARSAE